MCIGLIAVARISSLSLSGGADTISFNPGKLGRLLLALAALAAMTGADRAQAQFSEMVVMIDARIIATERSSIDALGITNFALPIRGNDSASGSGVGVSAGAQLTFEGPPIGESGTVRSFLRAFADVGYVGDSVADIQMFTAPFGLSYLIEADNGGAFVEAGVAIGLQFGAAPSPL